MKQGSYPIGNRALQPTDTLTGVVAGATADVPLSLLTQYINQNFSPPWLVRSDQLLPRWVNFSSI